MFGTSFFPLDVLHNLKARQVKFKNILKAEEDFAIDEFPEYQCIYIYNQ